MLASDLQEAIPNGHGVHADDPTAGHAASTDVIKV